MYAMYGIILVGVVSYLSGIISPRRGMSMYVYVGKNGRLAKGKKTERERQRLPLLTCQSSHETILRGRAWIQQPIIKGHGSTGVK